MSLTADGLVEPGPRGGHRLFLRVALGLAAVALVGGGVAALLWLAGPLAAPVPTRSPFGLGAREAAPAASGLGGLILSLQAGFYRSLQGALIALKASGAGGWTLIGLGFAYGVFHAAGPGHGKAVISAYLVANGRALRRGLALSLAAALLQALIAIAIVGAAAIVLQATAASMGRAVGVIETVSFAAVAALGALLTWRKAGKLARLVERGPGRSLPAADCAGGACEHVPLAPPPEAGPTRWRELAGIVLAAGLRPCAGAIVVLVFALSQGLFPVGVATVLAMALGTAMTTGAIASVAVLAKGLALRLAGGRGASGLLAVAGLEVLAAAFVLVLGASLLLGISGTASGS